MRPARLLPVAALLALGACSVDSPTALAPTSGTRDLTDAPSVDVSGRYIVAAKGNGFGNLAATVDALGGTVENVSDAAGLAVVTGLSDAAAAQLAASAGISEVQPDAVIMLDTPVATAESVPVDAAGIGAESATKPSTAALFAYQWNMRAIKADKAWAAGKLGRSDVTVAIIDTGIDYDLPDLAGRVDLSRSVSFVPSDDALIQRNWPTRNKIDDLGGHGTNVASNVASNSIYVAGTTTKTTLIGVKVLAGWGGGSLSAVLNGVIWAADHGADVANMSLGGGFAKAGNGRYVSLINRVFNYANKKGMLIVVAAGNDTEDLDHNGNELTTYCNQQHVVCVSATGPAKPTDDFTAPTFYTNYGRSAIDVSAPGGSYTVGPDGKLVKFAYPWGVATGSWIYSLCARHSILWDAKTNKPRSLTICSTGLYSNGYAGTSQATPQVSGLAALLVAEKGKGQPQQIKHLIEQSADDLGAPGVDPYYGRGQINFAKAFGL